MDFQTTSSTSNNENKTQNENGDHEISIDLSRIEALVTPEQVFSDSVARKRRKFTKRHSESLTKREATPVRDSGVIEDDLVGASSGIATTSEDDNNNNTNDDQNEIGLRPKLPERRRFKKKIKVVVEKNGTNRTLGQTNGATTPTNSCETPDVTTIEGKRESITDIAQAELLSLFNKTKKSITNAAVRGRDKFRKSNYKELVKRSKSAPNNQENSFTEEELIASFNKAQLLQHQQEENKLTVPRFRKYSNTSLRSLTPDEEDDISDGYEPKPLRADVQEFVRQRKNKIKQFGVVSPTPKIVEILDPTTSDVIAMKTYVAKVEEDFKFKEFIKVMRVFSVLEIYRQFKEFKREMSQEFVIIRKLWQKCLCELFVVVVYCGMGGMIFKFTEGRFENYYKCGVKKIRRDFIDLLWIKSHNLREDDWKSLARTRLRMFEEELHVAHEAGMTSYSGQRSWGFLNGVVYALTVVTTIGYGHMCPKTLEGRILTIVYALIGIPLFLIALTDFGKLFTRCIKFLWSFVRRLYYTSSCRNVRKTAQVQEIFKGAQMMYEIATFRRPSTFIDPENPQQIPTVHTPGGTITSDGTPTTPAISVFEIDDEFNLPISVALFILVAYIFCGAVMYMLIENWRFFESFYFVFISMSTIGFGDYVPRHPVFMIASIVYLVFGLALMSMSINVVQAKLSETFKQASAKIGATMGLQVDEDGSIITVPPDNVEIAEVHLDANKLSPHTPNSLSVNSVDVNLKDSKYYLDVKEKES